ncbi:(Fe-S)-binding protein [Caldiplasma sukawensis]
MILKEKMTSLMEQVDKCINCGFCEAVCPTVVGSGFNLSMGARGRVNLGKAITLSKINEYDDSIFKSFFSCLDCFQCLKVCPAGVNAGEVSHIMKTIISENGNNERSLRNSTSRMLSSLIMKYGSPLGKVRGMENWSDGLEFSEDSEYLFYTGHMFQLMAYTNNIARFNEILGEQMTRMGSYFINRYPSVSSIFSKFIDRKMEARMNNILRTIYDLLRINGIKMKYLGIDEPYPGTLLYDLGFEDEFREYSSRLADILSGVGCRYIITVDPHTYDLLKNILPKFTNKKIPKVLYYLELLKFHNHKNIRQEYALHEPCHLIIHDDNNIVKKVAESYLNVKIPDRNGKNTFCCGGPVESLFPKVSKKISNERIRQLENTNAKYIVTSCPICFSNLNKNQNVFDISEAIMESKNDFQSSE